MAVVLLPIHIEHSLAPWKITSLAPGEAMAVGAAFV